jgi:hypothetical protein
VRRFGSSYLRGLFSSAAGLLQRHARTCSFMGFVLWRFWANGIAERWATVTLPAEDTSRTESLFQF